MPHCRAGRRAEGDRGARPGGEDGMKDSTVKRFYDSLAADTAAAWYGNDTLLCTIREFLAKLPDRPAVLDLGCGTGHEAKRMHALGAVVTGIDFSSRSIAIARERTPECTFLEMGRGASSSPTCRSARRISSTIGRWTGRGSSGSSTATHRRPSSTVLRELGCGMCVRPAWLRN